MINRERFQLSPLNHAMNGTQMDAKNLSHFLSGVVVFPGHADRAHCASLPLILVFDVTWRSITYPFDRRQVVLSSFTYVQAIVRCIYAYCSIGVEKHTRNADRNQI